MISSRAAVAYAHADRVWAARPPPNSRVSRAMTTTDAIVASVAGIRIAQAASVNTSANACASSGVSGGWST
jgi:hypothetical protein